MLTLQHAVFQILTILCPFVRFQMQGPFCLLYGTATHSQLFSFHDSCSFPPFHSCLGPPATSNTTGPNQSDSSRGRHSGPQLHRIRKPHPHNPVEEGRSLGVNSRLQDQTAGHGRIADTLCKGKIAVDIKLTTQHLLLFCQVWTKLTMTSL